MLENCTQLLVYCAELEVERYYLTIIQRESSAAYANSF